MPIAIVDTSALAALVFGEPEAELVAKNMTGFNLVAPHLLWYELTSVCLKKIKRYPEKSNEILNAFQLAANLQIELTDVDHSAVVPLAQETNLTSYDAAFLWLSRECGGLLITLDQELKNHTQ
jgi:predicted nucleic acid-binding protein